MIEGRDELDKGPECLQEPEFVVQDPGCSRDEDSWYQTRGASGAGSRGTGSMVPQETRARGTGFSVLKDCWDLGP